MGPRRSAVVAAAAVLAVALPAAAVDIYINGVLVTGVRDQEFENVTVRLDADGNVRITAPHYRVERLDTTDSGPAGTKTTRSGTPPAAPPAAAKAPPRPAAPTSGASARGYGLARQYWLVAESSAPGRVQYRVEVRVNGQLVASFHDGDLPAPMDITEHLRPGSNAIRVTADKITEGARSSTSSGDWLRVVVADGHVDGSTVVIDHPGVIFTRTAAQTDRASRDFTLRAE